MNTFREKIVGEFILNNGEIKVLEMYKQYAQQICFVRSVYLRSAKEYYFVGDKILHIFSFKNEEHYHKFVKELNQSDDLFSV